MWLRDSAFIRSIIHSQNIALCDIYISKTNHTMPQLSPISNWMDVLPHPGNRICQKFIGFTDNKSLAIFQALCKLSNIILCHRVSWLGHDSGMCWSTLLTSPSKYLKCVFRMQKKDMLFFSGTMCRRLVPYLMPFFVSFFLWFFSYYKISGFHNFKLTLQEQKSCMYLIIMKY